MFQAIEQNQMPEKVLNEMETSSIPNKQFKALAIKMLNELGEEQINSVRISTHINKYIQKLFIYENFHLMYWCHS